MRRLLPLVLVHMRVLRETQEWPRFVATGAMKELTLSFVPGTDVKGFCIVNEEGVVLSRFALPTSYAQTGGRITVDCTVLAP
jgi:hypothetical protein